MGGFSFDRVPGRIGASKMAQNVRHRLLFLCMHEHCSIPYSCKNFSSFPNASEWSSTFSSSSSDSGLQPDVSVINADLLLLFYLRDLSLLLSGFEIERIGIFYFCPGKYTCDLRSSASAYSTLARSSVAKFCTSTSSCLSHSRKTDLMAGWSQTTP